MAAPALGAAIKIIATIVPKDKLMKWVGVLALIPIALIVVIIAPIIAILHIPLGSTDQYDLYEKTVREVNDSYGLSINWQHVMAIDTVVLEQEFDRSDRNHVHELVNRFVLESKEERDSLCPNPKSGAYDVPCKEEVTVYSQKDFDTVLRELVASDVLKSSEIEDVKRYLTFDLQEIKQELYKSDQIPSDWVPSEGHFLWPTPGVKTISSKFGSRVDPISGKVSYHYGIDIPVGMGTSVHAPDDGVVSYVGTSTAGGLTVRFDNKSYGFRFLHLSKALVKVGDAVVKDQIIAESGNSGTATTGPHLHFEVYEGGVPVDPLPFFMDH